MSYRDETIEIAKERLTNLPELVLAEVERLLRSGAVDPEDHSRGLLMGVAIENVADLWLRNERKSKNYKNLKLF